MQQLPVSDPDLVSPSLERLDFKKLQSHAEQYRTKCGMSEESQRWWTNMLQELKQFVDGYSSSSKKPMWPIERLQIAGETLPSCSQSAGPIHLPDHISRLVNKEVQSLPKVRIHDCTVI